MAAAYVLKRSTDQQFYFYLRADNNEVILVSETYRTKQGAENGIASCRVNSPIDARYKRWKSSDNKYFFTLVAGNGETIGTSETYQTQQGMENGITACKRHGPSAPTIDDT
jgi:uncharacterized protein YegP (UPF0339 family)